MKIMFLCRGAEYLGVEALSAALKANGHQTDLIFDPGFDDTFFFKAPFLKRFNNWPGLIERVKRFQPDILAVSSLTNTYPYIRELIRQIKEAYRCYVIIGGVHATAIPEYLLKEGLFDAVCVGEGDEAIVALADHLAAEESPLTINNFCFVRDGAVIINPLSPLIEDLDKLPFPDKKLFYEAGAFSTTVTVLSGRGCPFGCTFCVNDNNRRLYKGKGHYVRQYSPQRMVEELEWLMQELPIRSFNFQDDILTMRVSWLEEFTALYRKKINRSFQCNVHPKFVNDDVARLLNEAGCDSVCMGVQSAVPQVRRQLMHRQESNEEIEEAFTVLKRYRLPVSLEYIFGLPGETLDEIKENFAFNRRLRPANTATFTLYPFPGTTILEDLKSSGGIDAAYLESVYRGEGSYHYDSLLNLPDKLLSEAAADLMPILTKLPLSLGLLLFKLLARPGFGWLRTLVNLCFLPLNNFFQFKERMGNYLRMYRCQRRQGFEMTAGS